MSDDVLAAAARRAQRRFDAEAVIRSARRAGARVQIATSGESRVRDRFLAGSRNMASSLGSSSPSRARVDAGAALMELLGFADMVAAGQPSRPFQPLAFPALGGLAKRSGAEAIARQP
ncbi:MAG TPA: hypothetical protein VK730_05530 [Solirubrobacteraceae bacterium]|nr:hypothetical protein [Solirubrobacteraceae bacterium]